MTQREALQYVSVARIDQYDVVREVFGDQECIRGIALYDSQASGIGDALPAGTYFAP